MGTELYKALAKAAGQQIAKKDRWLVNEYAIVAETDDPENQHRIKVVIPSINEDEVYDEWVRPMTPFSMGDGFGLVMIPPKGSEVSITGVLAQKHNLSYSSAVYNEETRKSDQLGPDTAGIHVPANLKFIAELLATLQGENVDVIALQLARMTGEDADVIANALVTVQGQNATIAADQAVAVMGNTVTLHADGSITIQANDNISISATGNVTVSATGILRLGTRIVNKIGPTI